MRMRHFLFLVCFAAAAFGQHISLGVAGGGSLTDAIHTASVPTGSASLPFERFYSPSRDWILGASIEVRLPLNLSLEVNGLYRKLHFTRAGVEPNGSLNSVSPSPVVTWEFPVLAKYRFQGSKVNPFVELGPSFRTTGNLNGTNPSHYGITAGVGVEMHARRLNIAPTLRYTRWAADGVASSRPNSNPDQVEILIELSRASEVKAHPWGRHFSLGVIAGATLREDLPAATRSTPVGVPLPGGGFTLQNGTTTYSGLRNFVIGPAVEFALPKRLSVEVDALYHPLRYFAKTNLSDGSLISTSTFNEAITWEFPTLAKYRFPVRSITPFVELGPSFRLPQDANGPLSTTGVTAGAGIESHFRGITIAPAFRYTHWASDRTGVTRNQAEFLAGVLF
jgi:hypothetical protein